jgi:hypothetical protein
VKTITTVALATLLLAGTTQAITFRDYDLINTTLNSGEHSRSYEGTFNITTGDGGNGDLSGYNPAIHTLNSATASFTFTGGNNSRSFQVNLGNWSGSATFKQELNLGVDSALFLGQLQTDGVLNYLITRTAGAFTLVSAELNAYGVERQVPRINNPDNPPPSHAVPEGGITVALLGSAFCGLALVRRRLH